MQPVLNIQDIRRTEEALVKCGVSISELMHRAGAAVAQEVQNLSEAQSAVVLVGFGNNGGDGWVCAELLSEAGFEVCVVSPVAPDAIPSDLARVMAKSAEKQGIPIVVGPPRTELEQLLEAADVVVDAMLGIGLKNAPAAPFDIWIEAVNASRCRVISADVPSGLSAQTGIAPGACIVADLTVSMLALKPGLLADHGRDTAGSIVVAPLAKQTERLVEDADPVAWRSELPDYSSIIEPPSTVCDKYTRGSVLVVGGSSRFPGAAVLCAQSACRAGAGYVTMAVPAPIASAVQIQNPHIPVVPVAADERGMFSSEAKDTVIALAMRASAVVVGPGLRVSSATAALCSALLNVNVPLVMDADALNCLARLTTNRLDSFPELIRRQAPLVLTPHRRELGRLMGLPQTPPETLTSALEAARRIVWTEGGNEICVVAKGTATACVSVEAALLPTPGPAALATAGSGDVLSGIIGSLIAQKSPFDLSDLPLICAFACEIHGEAARRAVEKYGQRGVVSPDLICELGLAADSLAEKALWIDALPGAAQVEDSSEGLSHDPFDQAKRYFRSLRNSMGSKKE